jgi:glycosyltransferase involved in cell wall biosynthesis
VRLLTLSYEYPPVGGGGATVCEGLSEALVSLGHRVDVVTSAMADLPPYEDRNGVEIYRVPCWRRHQHYSTAPQLLTTILPTYRKALELTRSRGYDLVHCHFVVPTGAAAYLLKRRTGLPYVLTCHGSDVPGYNPDRFALLHSLIAPFWRRIFDASAAATAPSTFLQDLIKTLRDRSVEVIPNFFDPPVVSRARADGRRILVVSRVVRRKGIEYLIDAMAGLDRDWELLIAGDGPRLPEMRRRAAAHGLPVRFLGHVPRAQLGELYASAAIFVLPSLKENFPMVLLEAMAAGCAVVTTRAEGCREVVGDAAALVTPGSVDELRTTLAHLMRDEAALEELRRRGRKQVTQFSSAKVAKEFEALFLRSAFPHDDPAAQGRKFVSARDRSAAAVPHDARRAVPARALSETSAFSASEPERERQAALRHTPAP